MKTYYRPIVQTDLHRPQGALPLAGGEAWFSQVQVLTRTAPPQLIDASALPDKVRDRLTGARAMIAGLDMGQPQVMGILNVTPDSFSDGGRFAGIEPAIQHARAMVRDGATIIDIGGESTRPGADEIAPDVEIQRTAPVISALRDHLQVAISIDTRKAPVARAAVAAGANLVNDVAGFTFDPELAPFCAGQNLPVCVMHAQGDPQTMQHNPRYDDVLLDVYDFLEDRVETLVGQGISRQQITIDPGIGFGKTLAHNLRLLNGISLFHGLGCAILLGVSRKKFIGTIGNAPETDDRMPGSVAVALAGVAQGVQILRVHDVKETTSALALWQAVRKGQFDA